MEDLIKRSDAIKATWQEPTYTDPLNVLTEVRDRIESIPSADRPQGWILCSERLPEWNTRVLFYLEKECYYDYPEPQYVTDWWIQEGSFNDKYGVFIYDSPDIGKGIPKDCVVAWMPLPEPWKGADDE